MARIQKITRSDKHHEYSGTHMAFSDAGGMHLRDYFAAQILCQSRPMQTDDDNIRKIANHAYNVADMMMKVREYNWS